MIRIGADHRSERWEQHHTYPTHDGEYSNFIVCTWTSLYRVTSQNEHQSIIIEDVRYLYHRLCSSLAISSVS